VRKTAIVLLSALALVLGVTAVAGAATKPPYRVTLHTSVSSSTADHFLTVSGRVFGPRAAGKTVRIQRKYVGGSWVTVATPTTSARGTYAARVETPRGGTTSFRAIKARSTLRSAGTSAVRSIPVYRWLYLADQPAESSQMTHGVNYTMNGKQYPHSIWFFGDGYLAYKLAGLCTKVTTVAEYVAYTGGSPAQSASLNYGVWGSGPGGSGTVTLNTGTAVPLTISEPGTQFRAFNISLTESGYAVILGTPKAYCNADVLPTWNETEVD
jgi:hypothetical protein